MQCAETERLTMPDQKKYADLLGVTGGEAGGRAAMSGKRAKAARRVRRTRDATAPSSGRPFLAPAARGPSWSTSARSPRRKVNPSMNARTRVDACLRTQDHGPTPRAHVFATVDLVFQGRGIVYRGSIATDVRHPFPSLCCCLITRPFSAAPAGSTTFGPHDARTDLLGVGERTTGKRRSLSLC